MRVSGAEHGHTPANAEAARRKDAEMIALINRTLKEAGEPVEQEPDRDVADA